LFLPHKKNKKEHCNSLCPTTRAQPEVRAQRANLPDFSENNIVIEDATTLITISETFSQPESINSQLEPE
jgi:predicted nucleotide-binding protein (sugar kinase/HSP70/actin superfamily)